MLNLSLLICLCIDAVSHHFFKVPSNSLLGIQHVHHHLLIYIDSLLLSLRVTEVKVG